MTTPVPPLEESKIAVKIVEKIANSLEQLKREVTRESEELALRMPERIGEYSVALRIKSGFIGGKTRFPVPYVLRIQAHSLPFFVREDQALSREGDTFIFEPGKLRKGVENVLLRIEFQLPERGVTEALVQMNSQLDPLTTDASEMDKYWMTAQLRNPAALQRSYTRLDVLGVDFRVDVGVHQDVKTKVPSGVKRIIQRSAEFAGTSDREKLLRLALDQRKSARFSAGVKDGLRELTDLFLPGRFRRYVEVQPPFRFYDCERGHELFESLFATLPKFMTVTSRTDLSLDEPARQGFLLYKKKIVRDEIERMFPKP